MTRPTPDCGDPGAIRLLPGSYAGQAVLTVGSPEPGPVGTPVRESPVLGPDETGSLDGAVLTVGWLSVGALAVTDGSLVTDRLGLGSLLGGENESPPVGSDES